MATTDLHNEVPSAPDVSAAGSATIGPSAAPSASRFVEDHGGRLVIPPSGISVRSDEIEALRHADRR